MHMSYRVLVRSILQINTDRKLSKEDEKVNKEELSVLLSKELIIGYVYDYNGERQRFYFENSPSNIANFIMLHQENASEMVLTDMPDRMVLNTFGEFINQCPGQESLQEIVRPENAKYIAGGNPVW